MRREPHAPDRWLMFRIEVAGADIYRILAGWDGGYLGGDSWRINSGCTAAKRDGDVLEFAGYSGSVYRCHQDAYGVTPLSASILRQLQEHAEAAGKVLEVLPVDADWESLPYG